MLKVHLACAAPLVALAVWFGVVDTLPFGEGRCASCGVEGYVTAAHLFAALWLGAVVAYVAAARRGAREGVAAPGPTTLRALAAAALFVLAGLLWHDLFTYPALAAMIVSVALIPVATIGWLVQLVKWIRRPPRDPAELARRLDGELVMAWIGLVVLLPAIFGWVWTARVEWLVF